MVSLLARMDEFLTRWARPSNVLQTIIPMKDVTAGESGQAKGGSMRAHDFKNSRSNNRGSFPYSATNRATWVASYSSSVSFNRAGLSHVAPSFAPSTLPLRHRVWSLQEGFRREKHSHL